MTRQEPARYIDPRTGRYHDLSERRWRSDDGNPMMVTSLPGITRDDIEAKLREIQGGASAGTDAAKGAGLAAGLLAVGLHGNLLVDPRLLKASVSETHASVAGLPTIPPIPPGMFSNGIPAFEFMCGSWLLSAVGIGLSVAYVRACGGSFRRMADLGRIARTHPGPAAAIIICLLSLAGAPLTGGFFAKISLLGSLLLAGQTTLAVVFALVTAIMAAVCGRAVLTAAEPVQDAGCHAAVALDGGMSSQAPPMAGIRGQLWRLAITAIVTAILILGIFPALVWGV